MWEKVAIGLILQLAQGEDVGPGSQRLRQKAPRVCCEIVLGISNNQTGGLEKSEC